MRVLKILPSLCTALGTEMVAVDGDQYRHVDGEFLAMEAIGATLLWQLVLAMPDGGDCGV